ncbi:hypothetical protein [Acinetobacter sp. P1(2025)]|uniref:hypothetical protein n=1 Tax=Acinetobacter sp. P1(2025) TaxID=3446120 RepID=UPI003F53A0C8
MNIFDLTAIADQAAIIFDQHYFTHANVEPDLNSENPNELVLEDYTEITIKNLFQDFSITLPIVSYITLADGADIETANLADGTLQVKMAITHDEALTRESLFSDEQNAHFSESEIDTFEAIINHLDNNKADWAKPPQQFFDQHIDLIRQRFKQDAKAAA